MEIGDIFLDSLVAIPLSLPQSVLSNAAATRHIHYLHEK